ncbi:class I adenylate-forming enzyme family protein [Streptomyces sp. NPDC002851]
MPEFTFPELPLDGLLRRAAVRDPDGAAVTTERGAVSYAALDARADRVAAWLRSATEGRDGVRVGVTQVLDPDFAALYYGTARSRSTVTLVNPLLREAALRYVFHAARIEIAFVPTAIAEVLTKLRDQLPALRTLVVTDADDGVVPADAVPLHLALDSVPDGVPAASGTVDLGAVACVQFTTGTTGRPKGVRLTHRNLVANAHQIALAHDLGPDSVTVNHLPLYHVMHLNSAVCAGTSQLLCRDPDPLAPLGLAARTGATHLYGLPARLHRLAADPRLDTPHPGVPAGPALRAVLSGGTALAPAAAERLQRALGVPVIQGYGLCELSPLSHNQRLDDIPVRGAVGLPLPGTECRIVHPETRAPVPVWSGGEVQVRGPQVMAGYLESDPAAAEPSRIDADGWFSTGDVGYLNVDGVLYLVDRLDDMFKYDNELVSPTTVERALAEDPRVAECVVVGWPDSVHGAVVWAGIVLADPPPGEPYPQLDVLDTLDAIADRANEQLGPHERIRRVESLDAVPRTPTGKPERRLLRRQLRERSEAETAAAGV